MIWVAPAWCTAHAGNKDVCVSITDVTRGTECASSDSVKVSVSNQCGVKVNGTLIFRQASGEPIRQGLILGSGDHSVVWACHGTGVVEKDFSVDPSDPMAR